MDGVPVAGAGAGGAAAAGIGNATGAGGAGDTTNAVVASAPSAASVAQTPGRSAAEGGGAVQYGGKDSIPPDGAWTAFHRRLIAPEVHFLSLVRTWLFGRPLVLSFPNGEEPTNAQMYDAVWTQVRRMTAGYDLFSGGALDAAAGGDEAVAASSTASAGGGGDGARSPSASSVASANAPTPLYPFVLRLVNPVGRVCSQCPWHRFCIGCAIPVTDEPLSSCLSPSAPSSSSSHVAIDWDVDVLHLYYDASREKEVDDHPTIVEQRRKFSEPISLKECMDGFTKEEIMSDDELWRCSSCKDFRRAGKKIDLWRVPPVLVVHLKRFHFVNGRWVKSQKMVNFPINDFDPYDYVVGPQGDARRALRAREAKKEGGDGDLDNDGNPTTPASDVPSTVRSEASSVGAGAGAGAVGSADAADAPDDAAARGVVHNATAEAQAASEGEGKLSGDADGDEGGADAGASAAGPSSNGKADDGEFRGEEGKRVVDEAPDAALYQLYGVSNHIGMLGGGHYVAYAKNPENHTWYSFNDSACQPIKNMNEVQTPAAYTLFFERGGLDYEAIHASARRGVAVEVPELDDAPADGTGVQPASSTETTAVLSDAVAVGDDSEEATTVAEPSAGTNGTSAPSAAAVASARSGTASPATSSPSTQRKGEGKKRHHHPFHRHKDKDAHKEPKDKDKDDSNCTIQ